MARELSNRARWAIAVACGVVVLLLWFAVVERLVFRHSTMSTLLGVVLSVAVGEAVALVLSARCRRPRP